jgi:tRNA nucleotidyltransferase/poly(A) polymerase
MSRDDRQTDPGCFALDVVRRLQSAGYQALWAGGCVRDRLLGRDPKDYDVATNATPPEIRRVFARFKTLNIGAAFGVVAVVGPRGAGIVEVVTFRRDADYSDGRHPDQVTFSSPQEDAQRRDFTINGLFYDPLKDEVIDYVGGKQDLSARVIRAIGDPKDRFSEDKLRMLRAVRFAAHFRFHLDEQTKAAIASNPGSIGVVSPERIAEEMRLMLTDPTRTTAVRLLAETGLLAAVLPEASFFASPEGHSAWTETLQVLGALAPLVTFPAAISALVRCLPHPSTDGEMLRRICHRWRLSNLETDSTIWLVLHEPTIRRARQVPWPVLQRLLIAEPIDQLLGLAEAVAKVVDGRADSIEFCREKLRLPPGELNPAPLLTGHDLIDHGIPPGKDFQRLLTAARDAQLEKQIVTKQQALALVDQLRSETPS